MNGQVQRTQRLLRFLPLLVLFAGIGFGISACYEDYGLTIEDFDSFVTLKASDTDFQKFKFFVMPDTIRHFYEPGGIDPLRDARKFDAQILSLTASNFQARGYTRLSDTSEIGIRNIDPNTVFIARIGQFSSTYTGYYYDYWYGYGGYWGWYYPYYPPAYVGTYEYTTGTNVTEVVDYGRSIQNSKIVPVWLASISGLTGTPATAQARLSSGINRTFEQSPYFYTNP